MKSQSIPDDTQTANMPKRCERLEEAKFTDVQINKIFGPIGIKLGGRSAPEIALSIIAQLISKVYKK